MLDDINISQKLLGYKKELNSLIQLFVKKRFPKVLMLTGKRGIGKFTKIIHFLTYILDRKSYDLSKLTIKNKILLNQIILNLNQNAIIINSKNVNERKIDHIRIIKDRILTSTMNNKPRFIIIDDVDLLNTNSLNALLKIIEEPNDFNFFILINNKSKLLLETIKSRSIEFKLFLKENFQKDIIKLLIEKKEINVKIDYKNLDVTPGDFFFFNQICNEFNIDILGDINKNLDLLLERYRSTKSEIFINFSKFLIENYFYAQTQKDFNKAIYFSKLRSNVLHEINNYQQYNLNHKIFIKNLIMKL
tara:strand:+ start:100 stop:1011 length:912 start_codon:yes stop_codon:yes gene_type:complete